MPQTATQLEKNIAAFKNNINLLFEYLIVFFFINNYFSKKIKDKIRLFYNKKGMPYEIFNKIIEALNLNGV